MEKKKNMSLSKEDIELIKQIVANNPQANVEELVNTIEPTPIENVPKIIEKMSATALKKQFGTNIFDYKFIGIKDFMEKHNVTTGSKYSPTLNYENKHRIIAKVIQSLPAKQRKAKVNHCIKVLEEKIKNPPKQLYGKEPSEKQLTHIKQNLEREIARWKE